MSAVGVVSVTGQGVGHLCSKRLMDIVGAFGHQLGLGFVDIQLVVGSRVEAIRAIERRQPCCLRVLVVHGKLGHRKELYPVVLLVVDVGAEVLFYRGVHLLSLAMRLGRESGTEARIDGQIGAKMLPEARGELRSTVGDAMVQGRPCRRKKIWRMNSVASSSASTVMEQGTRCLCLVGRSTTTQIAS